MSSRIHGCPRKLSLDNINNVLNWTVADSNVDFTVLFFSANPICKYLLFYTIAPKQKFSLLTVQLQYFVIQFYCIFFNQKNIMCNTL